MTKRSDILLHPIRLRIVLATAGDSVTITELAQRLPDVPQASLYRHVGILKDAGMLDVASERPVRGTVERTYRVNTHAATVSFDDAASMTAEEHLTAFVAFAGALVDAYARYLRAPGASPAHDGVTYRQIPVWLTARELDEMLEGVTDAIAPYLDNGPTVGRSQRLFSAVVMPEPGSGRP